MIYLQVIYATAASWLVFNTLPTVWTGAGAAIICVTALLSRARLRG